MTDRQVMISVVIIAAVTAAIRFLPFFIFSGSRKTPEIISYLGKVLPSAIMGMLVVYCLKDLSFRSAAGFLPELLAGALTAGLHIWKRNTLLSIVAGTVFYMLLIRFVF